MASVKRSPKKVYNANKQSNNSNVLTIDDIDLNKISISKFNKDKNGNWSALILHDGKMFYPQSPFLYSSGPYGYHASDSAPSEDKTWSLSLSASTFNGSSDEDRKEKERMTKYFDLLALIEKKFKELVLESSRMIGIYTDDDEKKDKETFGDNKEMIDRLKMKKVNESLNLLVSQKNKEYPAQVKNKITKAWEDGKETDKPNVQEVLSCTEEDAKKYPIVCKKIKVESFDDIAKLPKGTYYRTVSQFRINIVNKKVNLLLRTQRITFVEKSSNKLSGIGFRDTIVVEENDNDNTEENNITEEVKKDETAKADSDDEKPIRQEDNEEEAYGGEDDQ